MAKKQRELTIEDKLRALFDLQLIDSRIDEIKFTRGELPLEVEDLEDEIVGIETRISGLTDKIKDFDGQIKVKKEEIKASEAQIKKYEKQQENVRNNREFDALTKEIEYQGLEIQLANKRIKEFKAKTEQYKETITSANEKLTSLKEHLMHKKEELDSLIAETKKEEDFLNSKSDEYSKNIEDRLLVAYKRIRAKVKNGLAVVPVERGASSGSYFTIPPQIQMEIAQRKKIIIDEHSGRILVDADLAAQEKEKLEDLLNNI
ncbi:MAG: zinc ribbon domain-containing protein [Flavobacteriales bacterium]